MQGYHKSVLFDEILDTLKIRDAWYLDNTLGDGGHLIGIIKSGGKAVGIDVDPEALERVKQRLKEEGITEDKYRLILGNFRDIKNLQTELPLSKFNGAIFDLGVSSMQLETPLRGFSFAKAGPLDMRMDPSLGVKALDLVNNLSRKELCELFYKLGEEKFSKQLADAVVFAREIKPFTSTTELADVIAKKTRGGKEKIHPATRVFQALRIAVNDELGALEEGLKEVKDLIAKGGRIAVISFHSLEDRIVKNTFKEWKLQGLGEILTKKPIVPSEREIAENPRSRSAKLRVFEIL